MSARSPPDHGEFATLGVDAHDLSRIAMLTVEDDAVLVYDREDEDAWIQSDDYIDLEFMA